MNLLILKKIFVWLKAYWHIPITLLIMGAAYVLTKKVISPNLLKVTKESYDKQIKIIEEIEEEKNKKYKEATKKYVKMMEKLEEERRINELNLAMKKKERIIKLMKENTEEQLAEKLAKQFGIKYTK